MNDQLYAVLNDGTVEGDSMFDSLCIPYEEKDTKESLIAKALVHPEGYNFREEDMEIDENMRHEFKQMKSDLEKETTHAWIVDEIAKKAVAAMYEDSKAGNDSAVYTLNRAAKNICRALSLRIIKFD